MTAMTAVIARSAPGDRIDCDNGDDRHDNSDCGYRGDPDDLSDCGNLAYRGGRDKVCSTATSMNATATVTATTATTARTAKSATGAATEIAFDDLGTCAGDPDYTVRDERSSRVCVNNT